MTSIVPVLSAVCTLFALAFELVVRQSHLFEVLELAQLSRYRTCADRGSTRRVNTGVGVAGSDYMQCLCHAGHIKLCLGCRRGKVFPNAVVCCSLWLYTDAVPTPCLPRYVHRRSRRDRAITDIQRSKASVPGRGAGHAPMLPKHMPRCANHHNTRTVLCR